jgi:hypothetical protein
MLFNPEVVNPIGPLPSDTARLFPKTSSLIAGRLFGMDSLQTETNYNGGYTPFPSFPTFTPDYFAHYPSHKFDVLFTDGSVKFVRSDQAINYLHLMGDNNAQYALLYQMLENAQ